VNIIIITYTFVLLQIQDTEGATGAAFDINNLSIASRLLSRGADIREAPANIIQRLRPLIADTWNATTLHSACYENDLDALKALLAAGKADPHFDINMRSADGWTALHAAVYLNRIDAVRILIDEGVDIMVVTDDERRHSALHIACSRGRREIVVLFMKKCFPEAEVERSSSTKRKRSGFETRSRN